MNPSYTQNPSAGYNAEPSLNFSTLQAVNYNNVGEQNWKHFLTKTPANVTKKLNILAVFCIIIGIVNVAIEFRLLHDNIFSFIIGFVNGFFLISFGILTFILACQQVYVLSNLFVVAYFQMLFTIATFIVYCIIFFGIYGHGSRCSYPSTYCLENEVQIALIVDLISNFFTFWLLITILTVITSARRPQMTSTMPSYVAYVPQTQPMHTSFHNPYAMAMNPSSTA
ncbi:unnamed protein product [Adineta steineri]|uniref:Uncharacterized protein n=2 Tax=Adineta steineri TaxID=433720 RepID=A0A818UX47_9BILA|nr:unnamed protein product [Adineta steineri]CAF3704100.1 unnamed protein product [Adineta steineri]